MRRYGADIKHAVVIELSKVPNMSSAVMPRYSTFVDTMKLEVNYAVVCNLEYGVMFVDVPIKISSTILCRLVSTNQELSYKSAIYAACQAVYKRQCLAAYALEVEHRRKERKESGHIASQLLSSV